MKENHGDDLLVSENTDLIEEYLSRVPDDDCIALFIKHCEQEVEMTKKVLAMGINPMSPTSPFIPIFAGIKYLEGGEEALEKINLSIEGVREFLKFAIRANQEIAQIAKKHPGRNTMIRQSINLPILKRKSFAILK